MFNSVGFEQGLHIRGTPLWLDASRRRELCVLTGLERRLPPHHTRLVASSALAAALQAAGYPGSILPSPTARWLGLGGVRLQLLDLQQPFGAAAAWVELPTQQLLVAGMLRAPEQVSWPSAEHFVARAPALLHEGLPLPALCLQLVQRIEALCHQNIKPTLWVDHLEVGAAVVAELQKLGQRVCPRGLLGLLLPKTTADKSALALDITVAPGRQAMARAGRMFIDSGIGGWRDVHVPEMRRVQYFATLADLRHIVARCQATQVTLAQVPPGVAALLRTAFGTKIRVQCIGEAQQLRLGALPSQAQVFETG